LTAGAFLPHATLCKHVKYYENVISMSHSCNVNQVSISSNLSLKSYHYIVLTEYTHTVSTFNTGKSEALIIHAFLPNMTSKITREPSTG